MLKRAKKKLRTLRKAAPCQKIALRNAETGEIVLKGCGRRDCPRCAPAYAQKNAEALHALHGDACVHIVFTVSNKHIWAFPKLEHYEASKNYTRERMAAIAAGRPVREPSQQIKEYRERIRACSNLYSQATRSIRRAASDSSGLPIEKIGYLRAIEFGEHKTKRWHGHFLLFADWDQIKTEFQNFKWDKDRKIYFGTHKSWPYGMLRIKVMYDPKGAIAYLAAYIQKNAPGRLTKDKNTSDFIRACQLFPGDESQKWEYTPIGNKARLSQSVIDKNFIKIKEELVNADMGYIQRHPNSQLERRLKRGSNFD